MSTDENPASDDVTRRGVLQKGAVTVGALTLGGAAFAGEAAASTEEMKKGKTGGVALFNKGVYMRKKPWKVLGKKGTKTLSASCNASQSAPKKYYKYKVQYKKSANGRSNSMSGGKTAYIVTRKKLSKGKYYRFNSQKQKCKDACKYRYKAAFGPAKKRKKKKRKKKKKKQKKKKAKTGGVALFKKNVYMRKKPWKVLGKKGTKTLSASCNASQSAPKKYYKYKVRYKKSGNSGPGPMGGSNGGNGGKTAYIYTRKKLSKGQYYRFNSQKQNCKDACKYPYKAAFGPAKKRKKKKY
jgi:hypothetical protein